MKGLETGSIVLEFNIQGLGRGGGMDEGKREMEAYF